MANKVTLDLTGNAVWPKLNTVDVYQPLDKKGKPSGDEKRRYITGLQNDEAWLDTVEATLKKLAAKHLPDCANPKLPIKKSKKTGERYIEMTSGEKYRPPVFDAANNEVPPSVIIGGGSRLKVRVTVNFYDGFGGGINLYINSIQLLKLSQTQFTSPFEKAEDGYVYGGSAKGGEEEDQRDHNDDADDGEESYAF